MKQLFSERVFLNMADAESPVQLFKDFQFSTKDGYEAEARKVVNMVQQWSLSEDYDLVDLGIQPWVEKARQQGAVVLSLVTQRVDNESQKQKGLMADARRTSARAIL